MTPSLFQVPPLPSPASQRASAGPPAASIFFNFPEAKKPIDRPSGDQNGYDASSVPGSARGASSSKERTQRRVLPEASRAEKDRRRPSGERAGGPAPSLT